METVLEFNICPFYMHFQQENALQSDMVIVSFSPKTVSPSCHLTLPLRARATVMSTRFFFFCLFVFCLFLFVCLFWFVLFVFVCLFFHARAIEKNKLY